MEGEHVALEIWHYILAFLNFGSLLALGYRFVQCHKVWDIQTRNLWATLMLWALAGLGVAIQGIIVNAPLDERLVFISVASFATPISLRRSF